MNGKDFDEEQQLLEEIRRGYEEAKFPNKNSSGKSVYARYKAELPIQFEDRHIEVRTLTTDIGGGGFRIVHNEPLNQDREYEFKIFLGALDRPISINGRVVRQRFIQNEDKFEIGIFFSNISDQDRVTLQNALAEKYSPDIPPGSEKRKFLRVPKLLFATVEIEGKSKDVFSGLIVDISMGGVRLLSARDIPEKAMLNLNVELEEHAVLKLKGKVVWGNRVEALKKFQHGIEFVYGVEFDKISSTIKTIIDEYLDFRRNEEEANLVKTLLRLGKEGKEEP